MSRALLNNAEIVDFVKANLIPVSAAVEQLQPSRYRTRESEQSKWFLPMAQKAMKEFGPAEFWKVFKTYQGLYVVGADGTPYMYKIGVAYDPEYFVDALKAAVAKFRSSPHQKIAEIAPVEGTGFRVDPSTSVVQVFSRIVPLPSGATISERSVGRDYMWITKDEVSELLAQRSRAPQAIVLPPTMVARMVRFHLLNHVGNIMRPFGENQVKKAEFKIVRVVERGDIVTFSFNGIFSSFCPKGADDAGEGSVDGNIAGEFDISKAEKKIARFRAYGEALAGGRNDSLKGRMYPVVFAAVEAKDRISQSVIPFWASVPSIAPTYEKPRITSK